jgi:hypothetical protein
LAPAEHLHLTKVQVASNAVTVVGKTMKEVKAVNVDHIGKMTKNHHI